MNNSTQKKFKQFVLSRKFNAGFTMGLMAKDLSIALQVARDTGTPSPLSALTKETVAVAQTMFGLTNRRAFDTDRGAGSDRSDQLRRLVVVAASRT